PRNTAMPDIVINETGVTKLLNELNPNKATGPDGVSSRFLKEFANQIAPGLTLVMQASLHQSQIPQDWKHALVAPVFKPGKNDKSKAENYRPISLSSVSCKVMEHIIHSSIISHLDSTNVLTDTQHGFRKNRSCESQLILTVHDSAKSLNDSKQIDSILLDFSKAFDKVDHDKLCIKLNHYGIRGKTHDWIKNYLAHRTQTVVLNGESSEKTPVVSGVPQGTVLGPLLFLVYINDLPALVTCKIRLFADDALIYRSIDSITDTHKLQEDLNQLITWESNWSMEFNPDKCKVLRVTNKRKIINQNYTMHNQILEEVDSAKYLGVHIHKKLSWNTHVNYTAKKAITKQGVSYNVT
ncbi:MAG: RNA-directed DNA polymerase, partial [Paracoccaceae bacterium]